MRLLLNEHIDKAVAEALREHGHDVIAVTEDAQLIAMDDELLLDLAIAQRRALVTYDVQDFRSLVSERLAAGESHFGAVFLSATRFPQGKRQVGNLIAALDELLRTMPADDAMRDREWWPT